MQVGGGVRKGRKEESLVCFGDGNPTVAALVPPQGDMQESRPVEGTLDPQDTSVLSVSRCQG